MGGGINHGRAYLPLISADRDAARCATSRPLWPVTAFSTSFMNQNIHRSVVQVTVDGVCLIGCIYLFMHAEAVNQFSEAKQKAAARRIQVHAGTPRSSKSEHLHSFPKESHAKLFLIREPSVVGFYMKHRKGSPVTTSHFTNEPQKNPLLYLLYSYPCLQLDA